MCKLCPECFSQELAIQIMQIVKDGNEEKSYEEYEDLLMSAIENLSETFKDCTCQNQNKEDDEQFL